MSVVSFTDYVPPPRFDAFAWTQIQIYEAPAEDGPWTLIETVPIIPVDPDPRNPQTRDFTTTLATLVEGWYKVVFADAAANTAETDPIHNVEPSEINFRPSVSLVARKNLSRTRDQFGNQVGTFTAVTRPTDTQVVAITTDILTEVADALGDEVPEEFIDDAANLAALRAAMQIELDYYSDQVRTDRSTYPLLKEQYDEGLLRLQAAISGSTDDGENLGGAVPGMRPHYSFPDAGPGFESRW